MNLIIAETAKRRAAFDAGDLWTVTVTGAAADHVRRGKYETVQIMADCLSSVRRIRKPIITARDGAAVVFVERVES
jgi:enoyl-CoA hydratase/carnithine racemase